MECNLEIEINERKDRKVMNSHRKMGESCVIYYKLYMFMNSSIVTT